jgi:hypothetical protein
MKEGRKEGRQARRREGKDNKGRGEERQECRKE